MSERSAFPKTFRLPGAGSSGIAAAVLALSLLAVSGFLSRMPADGYTRLDLTNSGAGEKIFSSILRDGEEAVLSWRNSLFGLDVTEVFRAREGTMVLYRITFADPGGTPPPEVKPADVEDLYHTGGAFTAGGIDKSFSRVPFRVSEVGNPKMKIRDRVVVFKQEVGFGGAVLLTAAPATWWEVLQLFNSGTAGPLFSPGCQL